MMKWNGSIYYNAISQDNVEVDRVVLELSPCPVIPSHYWQRPRTRRAEGMGTRRWAQGMGSSYLLPSTQLAAADQGWCRKQDTVSWLWEEINKFCPEEVVKILLFYAVTVYTSSYLQHGVEACLLCTPVLPFAPSFKRCFIISGLRQVDKIGRASTSTKSMQEHKASASPLVAPLPAAGLPHEVTKWITTAHVGLMNKSRRGKTSLTSHFLIKCIKDA